MLDTTPNPVSVAARLGGPRPTTELTLAASAVMPTPGGPAVLLTLGQVQQVMKDLGQVVAFYEGTAPAEVQTP